MIWSLSNSGLGKAFHQASRIADLPALSCHADATFRIRLDTLSAGYGSGPTSVSVSRLTDVFWLTPLVKRVLEV